MELEGDTGRVVGAEAIAGVDGSASTDDSQVVSYAWDFGDGETATGAKVSHAYATGGLRTVTLTVTDELKRLAGGVYGGVGGGVGGGGIVLPALAAIAMPVLIPVIAAGWFGGILLGARAIYLRAARKRAERLQVVFDGVAAALATKVPRRD